MSLEMRRKAKAAAATTTPTTAADTTVSAATTDTAAEQPKRAAKKKANTTAKVSGSMRTIASGRHYKDGHVAQLDESNYPKVRAVFDPAGRSAKSIDVANFDRETTVPVKELIAHLNQELFRPLFGQPLKGSLARDLVLGFGDVLTTLSEQGISYRIPNAFAADTVVRKERKARSMKNGGNNSDDPIIVPPRRAVRFRPTRAVKEFIASGV